MRTPRLLLALGAALLLPIIGLSAPAAHADETRTATYDGLGPSGVFYAPVNGTCSGPPATPFEYRYSSLVLTSQSSGPRAVEVAVPGLLEGFAYFVYRNGTCVRGATTTAPGTQTLRSSEVGFADGDRIEIRFFASAPTRWTARILQPGTANAVQKGKAKKYVSLPYQIKCGPKTTKVKITKKASKARSITFTAGGKKVGSVTKVKPGSTVKLTKIPRSATKIKAVVKLKGGGKATVTRAYSAC